MHKKNVGLGLKEDFNIKNRFGLFKKKKTVYVLIDIPAERVNESQNPFSKIKPI